MASRNKLTEGMRAGDLSGLLLPLISVDEYESKIDDKAIVFGFYVQDRDGAADLNRFIQKSPVSVLDTEVSPAPDQHGYYLVFIEMLNNERLAENIKDILQEIEPLVEIDDWQMRIRKTDGLVDFSEEALEKALKRAERTDEAIMDYLRPSVLDRVEIDHDTLTIGRLGRSMNFEIVGFGNPSELLMDHDLTEAGIDLSMDHASRCRHICDMLGEGWTVTKLGKFHLVLEHVDEDDFLLVKPDYLL